MRSIIIVPLVIALCTAAAENRGRRVLGDETRGPNGAATDENAQAFQQMLQGAVLEGTFRIRGKDLPPQKERYEIRQVTRQPEEGYWLLMTRVQYADHDVTVPIPVLVQWAGKTPVIVVDALTIPGLGTFDARVLCHDGMYAGTWRHGEISGTLWGEIRAAKPAP